MKDGGGLHRFAHVFRFSELVEDLPSVDKCSYCKWCWTAKRIKFRCIRARIFGAKLGPGLGRLNLAVVAKAARKYPYWTCIRCRHRPMALFLYDVCIISIAAKLEHFVTSETRIGQKGDQGRVLLLLYCACKDEDRHMIQNGLSKDYHLIADLSQHTESQLVVRRSWLVCGCASLIVACWANSVCCSTSCTTSALFKAQLELLSFAAASSPHRCEQRVKNELLPASWSIVRKGQNKAKQKIPVPTIGIVPKYIHFSAFPLKCEPTACASAED